MQSAPIRPTGSEGAEVHDEEDDDQDGDQLIVGSSGKRIDAGMVSGMRHGGRNDCAV